MGDWVMVGYPLGKGQATKLHEFSESAKRGGGHFQSKNLYCRFLGTLNFFEHQIDKKKSNFRVQGMFVQQLY